MADIQLRFHKDMLVLSAPLDYALENQGIDVAADGAYVSLLEPESVHDALNMHKMAGAAVLVTPTEGICEARLAHLRLEDRAADIAQAAVEVAAGCTPQHVLCEIGPSGLPLDPGSESSREQSISQYQNAVAAFAGKEFDAVLLNGMRTLADVRCALEGARRAYDGPVFASVNVADDGTFDGHPLAEFVAAAGQADVLGICGGLDAQTLAGFVANLANLTDKPLLAQIDVRQATAAEKKRASLGAPISTNPYPLPDNLADAAVVLRAAGAQFLRAVGQATPAYTGALAVVANGTDSVR